MRFSGPVNWVHGDHAAKIALSDEAVLVLLRQHFGEVDAVSLSPHIPSSHEFSARRAYAAHLAPAERILALYEASPFSGRADSSGSMRPSSGHEGFVVTTKRLCWKNSGEPACSQTWGDLDADELVLEAPVLSFGDAASLVLAEPEVQDACANAFYVLALSGHTEHDDWEDDLALVVPVQSGAVRIHKSESLDVEGANAPTTPAPASPDALFEYATQAQALGPTYFCWHCQTPLFETTPECAYCGVAPSATGWLRTA